VCCGGGGGATGGERGGGSEHGSRGNWPNSNIACCMVEHGLLASLPGGVGVTGGGGDGGDEPHDGCCCVGHGLTGFIACWRGGVGVNRPEG
jgi:hypothetical protein